MHYLVPTDKSAPPASSSSSTDPQSHSQEHGRKNSIEDTPQDALFPPSNDDDAEPVISPDLRLSDLTDAQILQLTQSLKESESSRRPLISPVEPLSVLKEEYAGGSPTILRKLDWLIQKGWRGVRRTRGDGDCFYRSLAFSYVERLLLAPDPALAVAMSLSTLQATQTLLDQAGFQRMVYEDFYDVLSTLISSILSPHPSERLTAPLLLDAFQSAETSNSIVVYLRLLTSAWIRADEQAFAPFLFSQETGDMMGVREFCEAQVEATGKEADHVQEMALSQALNLTVQIAYLDNSASASDHVDFHTFDYAGANGMHPVALLYRPGHFDILETREVE